MMNVRNDVKMISRFVMSAQVMGFCVRFFLFWAGFFADPFVHLATSFTKHLRRLPQYFSDTLLAPASFVCVSYRHTEIVLTSQTSWTVNRTR